MAKHPDTPRDVHRRAADHVPAEPDEHTTSDHALCIDDADIDDLDGVAHIDRELAGRILAYRDAHGGHIDGPDDLHHVPGLTSHQVNRLRERVSF